MPTVIDGQGQVFVGVSPRELFLAFGSYFRFTNWCHPPIFHRRLHKLMLFSILLVTHHAGRSLHRGIWFFFFSFLSICISECTGKAGSRLNIFLDRVLVVKNLRTITEDLHTLYHEHKLLIFHLYI